MKNILITGGTGLVGKELTNLLLSKGYQIAYLSRSEGEVSGIKKYKWDYKNGFIDPAALEWANIIVGLAGHSVADGRWTAETKKKIYDSRVEATRLIFEKVKELNTPIEKFIGASATGIYEFGTALQKEDAKPADNFLANVVVDWEKEIFKFETVGIPTAAIRIGVVLSKDGGALPKLLTPIKFGVGADLGPGTQLMPWVHIHDLARAFAHAIEQPSVHGPYNAVNGVCTNSEMNKGIAQVVNKKIWLPNVPAFLLKLALGEMSSVVLDGSNVSNEKIRTSGFEFTYNGLVPALKDLLY